MKQNIAVFDLDDVVAMMRYETSRVFTKMSGKEVPFEEWDIFCCNHLYGIDFCPQTMMDEEIIERCEPEADAKEAFKTVRDKGMKIAIVTARGWHNKGREVTEAWLSKHGLEVDELHVVDLNKTKYDAFTEMEENYNIVSFIDDQPKYIEQAVEHDAVNQVVVFDRPWNQQVDGNKVKRVSSLNEFADSL